MTKTATITAVEAVPIIIRGTRDFKISEGGTREHVSVLLRLRTSREGLEGVAEIVSAPPGKPEEFLEEIEGAIGRYVAPALTGLACEDLTTGMRRVDARLKGRPWTKAAVNVALHDLRARAHGLPVSAFLGGRLLDRVPVIGPVIGIDTPDSMAATAAAQKASGVKAVKVKIGETIAADTDRVRAVRAAIGRDIVMRLDANDHYSPADAIRLIRAIENEEPDHVEQPVSRRDLLGMAEVRRMVSTPIMTDDAVATPEEAMTVIRLQAADRIKVKVTKHGLDGARLIVDMAHAAGLGAVLGHVFELGLAAAAEAQFAATMPGLIGAHEIGSMQPMGTTEDIIGEVLHRQPGFIDVPDGPGLGVTVKWEAIERRSRAA
jgi:L-alanine-DL-glutamate epimerase-like enolase superfamily enzyme